MTREANHILNYRTRVAAQQTAAEIMHLLVGKRVSSINLDYREGRIQAITFVAKVADAMIPFRLQPNIEGVYKRPEVRGQGIEQAERVAWRIVLRWVEAQLAMVESNLAEIGQVFLPYAIQGDGETLWNYFQTQHQKQLANGDTHAN